MSCDLGWDAPGFGVRMCGSWKSFSLKDFRLLFLSLSPWIFCIKIGKRQTTIHRHFVGSSPGDRAEV